MIKSQSALNRKPKTATIDYHKNGFTLPLVKEQYETWIILFIKVVCFYCFVVPHLTRPLQTILAVCYSLAAISIFCLFLRVSLIDPGIVAGEKGHSDLKVENVDLETEKGVKVKTCKKCKIELVRRTKHCWDCRKCVVGFDHHCLFLNTCVGKKNYMLFIYVIGSIFIIAMFHLIMIVYLLYKTVYDVNYKQQAIDSIYKSDKVYLGILSVSSIPVFVVAGAFGVLILFHIFINIKGMTTYEFVIERRKKRQNRNEKKLEKEMKKKEEKIKLRKTSVENEWLKERERQKKKKDGKKGVKEIKENEKTMEKVEGDEPKVEAKETVEGKEAKEEEESKENEETKEMEDLDQDEMFVRRLSCISGFDTDGLEYS